MKLLPQLVISGNQELVSPQRQLARSRGSLVSWRSVTSISLRSVSGPFTVFSMSLLLQTRTALASVSERFHKYDLCSRMVCWLFVLQWNIPPRLTYRAICRCSPRTTLRILSARNHIWFRSTAVSTCFPDRGTCRRLNNIHLLVGYAQTTYEGFEYNGESDLDLEYGMSLVTGEQTVTLYQTGDMVEGGLVLQCIISDV